MHRNGHQLISLTADTHYSARLGVFFYTRFLKHYNSDLSDQSALEIRVRVRLRVALFLAFFTKNDEND